MHYVTKVEYLKNYQLRVTFSDGTRKEVDLAPYLKGEVFEPLKNINYFKTVQVNPDIDTICWDNGADLSPEFLYQVGK